MFLYVESMEEKFNLQFGIQRGTPTPTLVQRSNLGLEVKKIMNDYGH